MIMVPFPHEFSPLAEVASRFRVSVHNLLLWGAEGKLSFFIRLRTDALIKEIEIECPSCQTKNVGPDDCGVIYPLSLYTLKLINGDENKSFHPRLVCDNCQKDVTPMLHLDSYHPHFVEEDEYDNVEYYEVKDLLLKSEDLQQFHEQHKPLISAAQSSADAPDSGNQPPVEVAELFPGEKGEEPLIGWRAIAKPLGLKVGHYGKKTKALDLRAKTPGFPLMRTAQNKPYSYLSQLKKFLSSASIK